MTARATLLRAFHRALRDRLAKNDWRAAFSCSCPVIALLFAAAASKKAR